MHCVRQDVSGFLPRQLLCSHRNRPQLTAALDYLREGDTLVVWKLSRLARSLTQVIKTASDIHERGIGLKVLTQNIDTTTPEGRLFFHMTAAFDEFQRELIVENTRAGLAAAKKRGRRGGRPKGMDEEGLRKAEAMLKDVENYPFVGDVIDQVKIGRTAFYRYFPPDRIKELRREHSGGGSTVTNSRGPLCTFVQKDPKIALPQRDARPPPRAYRLPRVRRAGLEVGR